MGKIDKKSLQHTRTVLAEHNAVIFIEFESPSSHYGCCGRIFQFCKREEESALMKKNRGQIKTEGGGAILPTSGCCSVPVSLLVLRI